MGIANTQKVQTLLKYTYGIVPIVAGLDKLSNILTDWSQYFSLGMAETFSVDLGFVMILVGIVEIAVGIVEIAVGIVVLLKPFIGGYITALWLVLIAMVLIVTGNHLDVAVRDLVMAIGAYSLVKLSEKQFPTPDRDLQSSHIRKI